MPPELAPIIALRTWYENHDTKQKDLAAALGLSPQQLAELFSGRNKPTGVQLLKIQDFLNVQTMNSQPAPKTLYEAKEQLLAMEKTRLELTAKLALAQAQGGGVTPKLQEQARPFNPNDLPGYQKVESSRLLWRNSFQRAPTRLT